MTYREKLIQWNSTPKYKKEIDFLFKLIDPGNGDRILDFGCGIMTAINYFTNKSSAKFYGYDIVKYAEDYHHGLYDNDLSGTYDIIYLNHSVAHIRDPSSALVKIKNNLVQDGRLIIVTPNIQWLDRGYNEDKTVIQHLDLESLQQLVASSGYCIDTIGQFGDVRKDIHQHNRLSNERLFVIAKPCTTK